MELTKNTGLPPFERKEEEVRACGHEMRGQFWMFWVGAHLGQLDGNYIAGTRVRTEARDLW